mmetsp:Transcript_6731/g.9999  ORF Transcript_6731/g.9999 Transcript_6731/m.9999 type:complete len:130 (-) Transcript_6731:342-731(-)
MSHGNEDPLADPVAVIVTLQQYQQKLSSQVELLRQDVATSKTFQAKYGAGAWKQSNEHLSKSLSARLNMLKEVQFQLDLVSAGVRQGRGLCQKLHRLVGPPNFEVDVTTAMPRTSALTMAMAGGRQPPS